MFPYIYALLPVLAVALYMFLRSRYLKVRGRLHFLPAGAPRSSWPARIAESGVLLAIAAAVLGFSASCTSTGGVIGKLHLLTPAVAKVHVVILASAAAGALLSAGLAFLGFTRSAVWLMAGVLCGYGWMLNGVGFTWRSLVPRGAQVVRSDCAIVLEDDLEGVDVWINDVYLGKTPIVMPWKEFREKVPTWDKEPEEYTRQQADWVNVQERAFSGRPWAHDERGPLGRVMLPTMLIKDIDKNGSPVYEHRSGFDFAYACLRLGDEWGFSFGTGLSSGDMRGLYYQRWEIRIPAEFAARKKAIEGLIAEAASTGDVIDAAWLTAMEKFGAEGWRKLKEAAASDGSLERVLDQWAASKYGIPSQVDARGAIDNLLRIAAQARRRGRYETDGVDGRAVEVLTRYLDVADLVRESLKRVGRFDRMPASVSYNDHTGECAFQSYGALWPYPPEPDMDVAVLVHALFIVDRRLGGNAAAAPNPIETHFVPALMRACHGTLGPSDLAYYLGGPQMETYLLRQPWKKRYDGGFPTQDFTFVSGGKVVNKWLYLLARLDSPAGRRFRHEKSDLVMDLADDFAEQEARMFGSPPLFLFIDLDEGTDSLAWKYWPRWRAFVLAGTRTDTLRMCFKYLIKLEPFPPVEMYVDTWKESNDPSSWKINTLWDLRQLKADKALAVLEAVRLEIDQTEFSDAKTEDDNKARRRDALSHINAIEKEIEDGSPSG